MQKKNIINIIIGATAALLIPFFGNIYVSGWNWGLGDFIFAWVFLITFGLTFKFGTSKIANSTQRVAVGLVIVGAFAAVWVMLATG